jgi:Uma2 family endonuclease
MFNKEEYLDDIFSSPDAPLVIEEANNRLRIEQKRRENFYNEIDEQQKIEFINGEVILHSPVRIEHNDVTGNLYELMNNYVRGNKLGKVGFEKVMVKFPRNDYEPDIVFFDKKQAKDFTAGQVLFPIPKMIVEVLSKGTEKRDRGIKFKDFENNGVKEYWLIHPFDKFVEQYILKNKKFELVKKTDSGFLTCQAIKGFKIKVEAIFDEVENENAILEILNANKNRRKKEK